MRYYPVLIPTLNRFTHFKDCVESLVKCTYSDKTELVIGLDYPPSEKYVEGYKNIKDYIPTIAGFGKITVFEHNENKGPAGNFEILINYAKSQYDAYILSEDDNVFSPAFLDYMNKMLELYRNDDRVFSVGGFNFLEAYDQGENNFYFCKDNCAWGMGLWKNKVSIISTILDDRCFFKHSLCDKSDAIKIINTYPALYGMLHAMIKRNESWGDVMFTTINILCDKYQVRPAISLVRNCGYDGSGVHCCSDDDGLSTQRISEAVLFEVTGKVEPADTEMSKRALYYYGMPKDNKARQLFLKNILFLYKSNTSLLSFSSFVRVYYWFRAKLGIRTRIMYLVNLMRKFRKRFLVRS